jgi:plasmid maintenance system killer protein
MIVSFKCSETEYLFRNGKTRMWSAILSVVERKLTMLDAAAVLIDLRSPPEIAWRHWGETEKVSTASVSTLNGEFALFGVLTGQRMSKSSIITEVSND